jgi:O-methyltransferase
MGKMKHPENVKTIQGYFPESLSKLPGHDELRFCFVSLDADLYEPMYNGLKYFYPRLSKGGYIMIHDYNCDIFGKGVQAAVHKFANESNAPYLPIADKRGSAVIIKP